MPPSNVPQLSDHRILRPGPLVFAIGFSIVVFTAAAFFAPAMSALGGGSRWHRVWTASSDFWFAAVGDEDWVLQSLLTVAAALLAVVITESVVVRRSPRLKESVRLAVSGAGYGIAVIGGAYGVALLIGELSHPADMTSTSHLPGTALLVAGIVGIGAATGMYSGRSTSYQLEQVRQRIRRHERHRDFLDRYLGSVNSSVAAWIYLLALVVLPVIVIPLIALVLQGASGISLGELPQLSPILGVSELLTIGAVWTVLSTVHVYPRLVPIIFGLLLMVLPILTEVALVIYLVQHPHSSDVTEVLTATIVHSALMATAIVPVLFRRRRATGWTPAIAVAVIVHTAALRTLIMMRDDEVVLLRRLHVERSWWLRLGRFVGRRLATRRGSA